MSADSRPCQAFHPEVRVESCAICRKFATNPAYNRLWGGAAEFPERPKRIAANKPVVERLNAGPGTELKKLLKSIGIEPGLSCGCDAKARQMDEWGIEGCEKHREEILQFLRGKASSLSWAEKIRAAAKLAGQGVWLSPLDPAASLLEEAIRRAVVKS